MGLMTAASFSVYETALRRLFPPGDFWDRQFQDAESDVSRWCAANAEELYRLKLRLVGLPDEAIPGTATELIDDWERVLALDNRTLDIAIRRRELQKSKLPSISLSTLKKVAEGFGAELVSIKFPFAPAIFGFSRFGSRLATPAAWSTLYLYLNLPDMSLRASLEESLTSVLMANQILVFFYRTVDDEYVP